VTQWERPTNQPGNGAGPYGAGSGGAGGEAGWAGGETGWWEWQNGGVEGQLHDMKHARERQGAGGGEGAGEGAGEAGGEEEAVVGRWVWHKESQESKEMHAAYCKRVQEDMDMSERYVARCTLRYHYNINGSYVI
jgi:hypothetical protein